MIDIGINPILVTLGPFSLAWHGIFTAVGIAVGIWIPVRLVARAGLSVDRIYSIALWGVPGGIIGARLVHVVDYWGFYSANPGAILAIWEGGLAIWGAILGGALTAVIVALVSRFTLARYADLAGLGLIMAQAIGRIGDIINGEHLSRTTTLPWGVVYTHPNSPSFGLPPQHPAVAYELLMDLVIFGILWKLRNLIRPDGALFLLYLALYATGRFFLSFLRLDSNTVFLYLTQPQLISVLVVVVTAILWVSLRASKEKNAESQTS
jgi:phosphatidylglycerol:prolipoprotein diacylglycerol transferase